MKLFQFLLSFRLLPHPHITNHSSWLTFSTDFSEITKLQCNQITRDYHHHRNNDRSTMSGIKLELSAQSYPFSLSLWHSLFIIKIKQFTLASRVSVANENNAQKNATSLAHWNLCRVASLFFLQSPSLTVYSLLFAWLGILCGWASTSISLLFITLNEETSNDLDNGFKGACCFHCFSFSRFSFDVDIQ